MRIGGIFALAAATFILFGESHSAHAAGIGVRAGDIGRSIEKVANASGAEKTPGNSQGQSGAIPLPAVRLAVETALPTPQLRPRLQLASYGNAYLTAMPTLIKPRVLSDTTAALGTVEQDDAEKGPQPRFVTWLQSRTNSTESKVVKGGARQACFHCLLRRKAEKHGVPFRLARAIVQVESSYRRDAVGGVGEIGLMQIRPQTARWLGFKGVDEELFNPRYNLEYGVKYLGKAWRLGEGRLCRVILKYNAGHNAKRMNPMSKRYCDKVEAILDKGLGAIKPIKQASL